MAPFTLALLGCTFVSAVPTQHGLAQTSWTRDIAKHNIHNRRLFSCRGGDSNVEVTTAGPSSTIVEGGGDSSEGRFVTPATGRVILLVVAFLYGCLNTIMRSLQQSPGGPSPSVLTLARGILAALSFGPILLVHNRTNRTTTPSSSKHAANQRSVLVRAACELALWNAGTQGLINAGLAVVPAARASFLIQTSVVLTPLVSVLVYKAEVQPRVWLGTATAFLGLATLSMGGAVAPVDAGGAAAAAAAAAASTVSMKELPSMLLGVLGKLVPRGGDLICLSGACCWSLYIIRLEKLAPTLAEIPLQALKTALLVVCYAAWAASAAATAFFQGANGVGVGLSAGGWDAVLQLWPGWRSPWAWGLLLFSAVGPGAIADVLQQVGQRGVGASEANVLLCAEPLFTALTARLCLGETTSWREKAGGGLILAAALVASGALEGGALVVKTKSFFRKVCGISKDKPHRDQD